MNNDINILEGGEKLCELLGQKSDECTGKVSREKLLYARDHGRVNLSDGYWGDSSHRSDLCLRYFDLKCFSNHKNRSGSHGNRLSTTNVIERSDLASNVRGSFFNQSTYT